RFSRVVVVKGTSQRVLGRDLVVYLDRELIRTVNETGIGSQITPRGRVRQQLHQVLRHYVDPTWWNLIPLERGANELSRICRVGSSSRWIKNGDPTLGKVAPPLTLRWQDQHFATRGQCLIAFRGSKEEGAVLKDASAK